MKVGEIFSAKDKFRFADGIVIRIFIFMVTKNLGCNKFLNSSMLINDMVTDNLVPKDIHPFYHHKEHRLY